MSNHKHICPNCERARIRGRVVTRCYGLMTATPRVSREWVCASCAADIESDTLLTLRGVRQIMRNAEWVDIVDDASRTMADVAGRLLLCVV